MPRLVFLGFVAGACAAAVLTIAASGFAPNNLMAAILLDPTRWLGWPVALGGAAGAALSALRR